MNEKKEGIRLGAKRESKKAVTKKLLNLVINPTQGILAGVPHFIRVF
jgi:hypothetical protein